MASQYPVVKNDAGGAILFVTLDDFSGTGMEIAPVLAAGDVKLSIDGAALANLATLPVVTPAGSAWVKIVLSQAETNGDWLLIQFIDQTAPKAWTDTMILVPTVARRFNDLEFPLVTGRGLAVDAAGGVTTNAIGAGAITTAAFAAGAIDANAIATDAIGSAELAASAITEIQTGLATAAAIAAVQADTDDIQARLPAALVGGKMDSNVGTVTAGAITNLAFAAGAIDANAIATDAIGAAELAASAVTEIQTGLATAAGVPTAAQNANALLDQVDGVEAGLTPRQWLRLAAAVLFGRASGMATTTAVFRDTPNTKNRVTATVDTDGNRSAVTLDPT